MNGPTGHFAAGLFTGIALASSIIDTVLQRSRQTTFVHCSGRDPLPALASEATGQGFLDTLSHSVQLGLFALVCGCSIYAWFSSEPICEGCASPVLEISDIDPVVSTPSSRRRKV